LRIATTSLVGVLAAALTASAVSCSSLSVHYDYDREADLSQYRTYAWVPGQDSTVSEPSGGVGERSGGGRLRAPTDPVADNPLTDERIRKAVEQTLSERGYRKAPAAGADFLVAHYLTVRDKLDVSSFGSDIYDPGFFSAGSLTVSTYQEGTLIIDIIDRASDRLVWRGWAVGTMTSPRDAGRKIPEAVAQIFRHFPKESAP